MSISARTRIIAAGLAVGAATVLGVPAVGAEDAPDLYVGPSSTIAPEALGNEVTSAAAEVSSAGEVGSAGEVASAAEVRGSALAFTGGDAAGLALVGGTALVAGTGLVLARRRQLRTA